MPLSVEKFFLGHSMVTNKAPKGVTLEEIKKHWKEHDVDLESLGLFEVSAPNFNTYYPDVKPEDLVPQDADFAYPVFRALSMTRVNKWGPINFGVGNVLEKSLKKLKGQAVYTNHEMISGNEVGVIFEVFWDDAYVANKVKIPAGINVRLKLDGKSNPKLVRNIMMDPPAVHSVSVTVEFMWEQSHPEMVREDFYNKLGTYDSVGKLIERVVTDIVAYHEISLVPHGADPYAQKVTEEGGINNPEYAANRSNKMSFSAEVFQKSGHYMDWKDRESYSMHETIPLTQKNTHITHNSNSTDTSMDEQMLIFLRTQLGLAADAPEAVVLAKLKEKLPALNSAQQTLTQTQTELSGLKTKYPEGTVVLTEIQKAEAVADKAALAKYLTAQREEAIKLYHIVVGGAEKADTAMVAMISGATPDVVTALLKQYKSQADEKFTASCQACGSTNVKRTTSASNSGVVTHGTDTLNTGGAAGAQTPATTKTNSEVMQELSTGKGAISANIHEQTKPGN